jgi:molybdopterin-guanine dinucleotide biosynthesis protein A
MRSAQAVGVVLAGGASRRMGRSKASLPFGDGTLLDWAVGLVRGAAPEVWVSVGSRADAAGAPPKGAAGFLIDPVPGAGPLAALRVALAQIGRPVLLVACDLPFLDPADLAALAAEPPGADAVVLADADGPQPLAALYGPALLPAVEACLARGEAAMRDLLAATAFRARAASPRRTGCAPLANLNTPEEYAAALAAARASGLIARS